MKSWDIKETDMHTVRRRCLFSLKQSKNRSYMPNESDKETLIMGIATDYYTFKHSPCCFPVANEACFWYLQLS